MCSMGKEGGGRGVANRLVLAALVSGKYAVIAYGREGVQERVVVVVAAVRVRVK